MINKYNRMIKFVSIKSKQNHIKRQLYTEYFSAYNCLIFYISLYSYYYSDYICFLTILYSSPGR